MQILSETLSSLEIGQPVTIENLTVFPLKAPWNRSPDYLTLDEALAAEGVTVSEISESGSVPELAFENRTESGVALFDGEELVGAKQNRILNLTILVPAGRKITIPVSCVERGRWAWRGRRFASSGKSLFAKARAEKVAQVSMSMRERGERRSDQSRIWASVEDKLDFLAFDSATSSMNDAYRSASERVGKYVEAVRAEHRQVGAVFAIDGQVAGVELFDTDATFAKFLRKLTESYALDAIETAGRKAPPADAAAAKAFVERLLRGKAETFPAVGEGEDVRLAGEGLTGAALVARGRVVHLSAFPADPDDLRTRRDFHFA